VEYDVLGAIAVIAPCNILMRTSVTAPSHLFMTADTQSGVWTYALDLARGLAPLGVRTTLAIVGPEPTAAQLVPTRTVPGLMLLPTGVPLDAVLTSARDVEESSHVIASVAARVDPDLVQVNSPPLAAAGAYVVPLVVACHSCVATWWHAVKGMAPWPADVRWRAELTARALGRADALIAPSAAFAASIAGMYQLPRLPRVARNGRWTVGRTLPEAPPADYVFTAGRLWDEGKNVLLLDEAAARVNATIIAAGPLRGPAGQWAAFTRLHTPGALSAADVAALLAERPVFVSTAVYEPFGLPVLEAAQAGCALVLADIATFRELWDGAAVFVNPNDAGALAAVLNELLADGARRARLATAARDRARRYTLPAMVQATLSAWGFPSGAVTAVAAESVTAA
jgi:glycosyltransferase involved in cell wall biosynthesis